MAEIHAQEPSKTEPAALLAKMSWISGHWTGEAMGGSFEETWNPPMGGTMMGMFKFVQDENVGFYEILTIAPKDDSLVLRLKHFHSDLKGWEEKDKSVEFPLIEITDSEAKFDGLIFRKVSDNEMQISVTVQQGGGDPQVLQFDCKRFQQK